MQNTLIPFSKQHFCPSQDRENMTRRLAEEHDMRRLEQMEMQQRLDNNEKSGKTDITELYGKMKREQEARETETDEIREKLNGQKNTLEEKIIKEKQVEKQKQNKAGYRVFKAKCVCISSLYFSF